MKSWIQALILVALFSGCTTSKRWLAVEPFAVVPYPSVNEIVSGKTFSVRFVVYNTSREAVFVPDPKKLSIAFQNIGTDDPLIDLGPLDRDGANFEVPPKEMELGVGEEVEATLACSFSGEGVFLISAWGYNDVKVPVRIIKEQ